MKNRALPAFTLMGLFFGRSAFASGGVFPSGDMQSAQGLVQQAKALASASAAPPLSQVVPGAMGLNALPTLPDLDPLIGKQLYLNVEMTSQFGQGNSAAAPYFHLIVPFDQVVAFDFDMMPVESFTLSPNAQALWHAPNPSGISKGDLRFGAHMDLVSENATRPEIGFSFLTKTTTGKDFNDRQFTDAPAYYVNALLGKDLLKDDRFLKKVRMLFNLGFFAWQQTDRVGQDDALSFGGTLIADLDKGLQAQVEYRGYTGWQGNDAPRVLSVSGIAKGAPGAPDWVVTFNQGLQDAPSEEARVGLTFWIDAPKFPLK